MLDSIFSFSFTIVLIFAFVIFFMLKVSSFFFENLKKKNDDLNQRIYKIKEKLKASSKERYKKNKQLSRIEKRLKLPTKFLQIATSINLRFLFIPVLVALLFDWPFIIKNISLEYQSWVPNIVVLNFSFLLALLFYEVSLIIKNNNRKEQLKNFFGAFTKSIIQKGKTNDGDNSSVHFSIEVWHLIFIFSGFLLIIIFLPQNTKIPTPWGTLEKVSSPVEKIAANEIHQIQVTDEYRSMQALDWMKWYGYSMYRDYIQLEIYKANKPFSDDTSKQIKNLPDYKLYEGFILKLAGCIQIAQNNYVNRYVLEDFVRDIAIAIETTIKQKSGANLSKEQLAKALYRLKDSIKNLPDSTKGMCNLPEMKLIVDNGTLKYVSEKGKDSADWYYITSLLDGIEKNETSHTTNLLAVLYWYSNDLKKAKSLFNRDVLSRAENKNVTNTFRILSYLNIASKNTEYERVLEYSNKELYLAKNILEVVKSYNSKAPSSVILKYGNQEIHQKSLEDRYKKIILDSKRNIVTAYSFLRRNKPRAKKLVEDIESGYESDLGIAELATIGHYFLSFAENKDDLLTSRNYLLSADRKYNREIKEKASNIDLLHQSIKQHLYSVNARLAGY